MGMIKTAEGKEIQAEGTIEGNPSVLVDAVIVPDGEQSVKTLMQDGDAKYYFGARLSSISKLSPLRRGRRIC